MVSLELIMSSGSAVAHLAGALGRPSLGGLATCPRLALDDRAHRLSVVSDDAALPSGKTRRLG